MGSVLLAAAAVKTPTRKGYNARDAHLCFVSSAVLFYSRPSAAILGLCSASGSP